MKTPFLFSALLATLAMVPAGEAALVTASEDTVLTNRAQGPYVIGFDFTVAEERVIDALGVEDSNGDGLAIASEVALWDITNAPSVELARVTVPTGETPTLEDGFRYMPLDTLITLSPGKTYRLGAVLGPDNPFTDTFSGSGGSGSGFSGDGVTLLVNRWANGGTLIEPTLDGTLAPGRWVGANATLLNATPDVPLQFTSITHNTDMVTLIWESKAGVLYNLRSSTDLSINPSSWGLVREDIVATPPENSVQVSTGGLPTNFFVLEEFPAPPPPPAFFDDFESVPNPDWTFGANGGDAGLTMWERGAPVDYASAGTRPTSGANGSATCFGTDLDADFAQNTDIYLRSPAIDLTAPGLTGATLTMQHFLDTDFQGGDLGSIRVLRASDLVQLGSDVASGLEGIANNGTDWRQLQEPLPVEALGQMIILEFQFTSDAVINSEFSGWYIDEVTVTVE